MFQVLLAPESCSSLGLGGPEGGRGVGSGPTRTRNPKTIAIGVLWWRRDQVRASKMRKLNRNATGH